jgi:ribosome-associated protein
MDIRKLQRCIVDGLEDVKGQNIVVFDTEHLSALFERVIIASGTSNRQTKALAASVRDAVKAAGFGTSRLEGEANGEWIIVDCGAAVVHLMQPSIREYYRLEEIWGDKPVKMKIDHAPVRLVKASPAEKPAAAKKAAAKKAPATKVTVKVAGKRAPVARTPVAKAPPSRKAGAGKAVAKRPAVKRVAPAKTGITRTVGVKTPAARKTAAKTPVMVIAPTKKAAAKKAAAKKAPARKVATKKASPRA